MQKLFNHLVIPVSIQDLDRKVIEKAAAFANQVGCHLHIICLASGHTSQPRIFTFFRGTSRADLISQSQQTAKLEASSRELMNNGLKLRIIFREKGSVISTLRQYHEANNIDLLLVCNELSPNSPVNNIKKAGDLSSYINCPVLYAPSVPDLPELNKIVLPVDEFLPVNKIRIAIYLASQFNAVIHLLAVQDNNPPGKIDYLKRTYAVLKENTNQPFVCRTVPQKNLTRAAVEYAREIQAGLVMAKPIVEKNIFSALSPFLRLFSGKRKQVAVMAVN